MRDREQAYAPSSVVDDEPLERLGGGRIQGVYDADRSEPGGMLARGIEAVRIVVGVRAHGLDGDGPINAGGIARRDQILGRHRMGVEPAGGCAVSLRQAVGPQWIPLPIGRDDVRMGIDDQRS